MAKRDILKEAIADAKAVKEVAIANAKAALEEAFTPKLKSMLAAKIQEMDEVDEMLDKNTDMRKDNKNEGIDEEFDLDEILAELEKDTLNEVEEEEIETEEEVEVEDDDTEEEVEVEDDETESVDIEDMTDEDLKIFIEDVIGDMVANGDLEAGEGFESEGDVMDYDDDEDLDIEIEDDETEEVEIAEIRRSRPNPKVMEQLQKEKRAKIKAITEMKKLRRELKGAYAAVNTQKSTLNEVRLLNAKLLYTNKIFKAKSLNENEKVKVLSSFDKATTIKETKLIFETLSEGLNSKRKPIRESLGSASKLTSNFKRTKNPIIATDPMVERFQKLAGLK